MDSMKITMERTHYFSPAIHILLSADIVSTEESNTISFESLKASIVAAVTHHSLLTSQVLQDEQGDCYYVPCQTCAIPITRLDTQGFLLQQLINEQERIPFDLARGELLRFFFVPGKSCAKLILIAHHLAGDGLAAIYLLRDIMNELGRLSSFRETAPITLFQPQHIPAKIKLNFFIRLLAKELNRQWLKTKHIFRYDEFETMFHLFWSERKTNYITHTFTKDQLHKLLEVSKARGITINSIITTAFLFASNQEEDVGLAVSIRPEGYEGMGNYATGISILYQYDKKLSFWKNAARVQKLIHRKLTNEHKKYFLLQFLDILEPTLIDAAYFYGFSDFENAAAARVSSMFGYNGNPKGISITNLTKAPIPDRYGTYQLQNLLFLPPLVPNAKHIIGVVTLGDTMTISIQFLKEHKEKETLWFNQAMKELLL